MRAYGPEGAALRTVRWRAMGSILQSAAIFTISSIAYMINQFVSQTGLAFCHYMFPSIVVRPPLPLRCLPMPTRSTFRKQSLVFSLTVTRISLASGADAPRRRHSLFQGPHSQSCPTLPLPVAAEEMRAVEAEELRGNMLRAPIAIHVSVTTTRSSDRESLASFDADCAVEKEAENPRSDVSCVCVHIMGRRAKCRYIRLY